MEYRQNADWRESDHPRDSDGKFTEKGLQAEHLTNIRTADRKVTKDHGQVKLSKQDYAIVCHARAEKIAVQKRNGKMPRRDYVFTDKKFVVFTNKNTGKFLVTAVLDIEQEREQITKYLEIYDE